MFGFKKRKKDVSPIYKSPEEYILELNIEKEKKISETEYSFEKREKEIKEKYQQLLEKENEAEKNVSFPQMLFDSERENKPLVYEITHSSIHATYVIFSRGKFTLNPYRIEVNNHRNVIFLTAYKDNDKENTFISLYYDKIKKTYTDFKWFIEVDYVEKQQMKQFLYGVMKSVSDDKLLYSKKFQSEYSAYEAFQKSLEDKGFKWKEKLANELSLLHNEKSVKLSEIESQYASKLKPHEKTLEKKKEQMFLEEEEKRLRRLAQSEFQFPSENNEKETFFSAKGRVFDSHVSDEMKKLFYRVHEFLNFQYLLDSESKHDISSLYEKDIHELWYSFINLEQEKQQVEKTRFLNLLKGIHYRLDNIEEKIKFLDTIDYEKKMQYLEHKYKEKEMQ